ncbi:MAG: hypothetical protein COA58_15995 [Bacteroidetes bacterium]|nr:MAG: hypothetical protein COA58_15995 [Bacteroidota bacterium]
MKERNTHHNARDLNTQTSTELTPLTLLTLVILCCSTLSSYAQNVSGTVTDSITHAPIAYATIVWSQDGFRKGVAYSDDYGRYLLNLNTDITKMVEVTVRYLGYANKKIAFFAKSDTTIHIFMSTSPETMSIQTIVVRASRPLVQKDKNSRTLSSKDISRLPTRSLNRVAAMSVGKSRRGEVSFFGGRRNSQVNYVDGLLVKQNARGNESYAKTTRNAFKNVRREPLSTVSIDVDKASYSNVRRFINNGTLPPVDAVRVEEMINYFRYDYPKVENDEPISRFTQMTTCPWNKDHQLLQIGIKGKSMQEGEKPNSNLVFLIDVSGSMRSLNKLDLVKKSLTLLLENLQPEDRVAIVVYAGSSGLVLPSTRLAEGKVDIIDAIYKLESGGSTAGGAGIKLAYKTAIENFMDEGNNRVILCTDGDFNVGVSGVGELEDLISDKKESGVFLSVLGFGMGNYKDDNLETLADKGNGNYAYIDDFKEAKKVFMNEVGSTLYTVAKDVKIQVEFNPRKVKKYRLIGYENRVLNAEDFNDDKKDAGELGENGTVTFLYEIILAGAEDDEEPKVDSLKYQTSVMKNTELEEYCTVKFRYKEPNGAKSKLVVITHTESPKKLEDADENIKLASAIALYGMILSESDYAKNKDLKDVAKYLSKIKREGEEMEELKALVKKSAELKKS